MSADIDALADQYAMDVDLGTDDTPFSERLAALGLAVAKVEPGTDRCFWCHCGTAEVYASKLVVGDWVASPYGEARVLDIVVTDAEVRMRVGMGRSGAIMNWTTGPGELVKLKVHPW